MNKQMIIDRTVNVINHLPEDKAEEISTFADFIFNRYEESQLTESIQKLASNGETFQFLNEDEETYSLDDLKEIFNGKR